MRTVRYSRTFALALDDLLAQGSRHYNAQLLAEKRALVRRTLEYHVAAFPRLKRPHPDLGLVVYPIRKTPFVVLYDFDDSELRAHFILHKRASLDDLDPTSAQW
jgi:hypothetical protein